MLDQRDRRWADAAGLLFGSYVAGMQEKSKDINSLGLHCAVW